MLLNLRALIIYTTFTVISADILILDISLYVTHSLLSRETGLHAVFHYILVDNGNFWFDWRAYAFTVEWVNCFLMFGVVLCQFVLWTFYVFSNPDNLIETSWNWTLSSLSCNFLCLSSSLTLCYHCCFIPWHAVLYDSVVQNVFEAFIALCAKHRIANTPWNLTVVIKHYFIFNVYLNCNKIHYHVFNGTNFKVNLCVVIGMMPESFNITNID